MQKFYSTVNSQLPHPPTSTDVDTAVNTYRHGIAHRFFPKQGMSIGYFDYTPDLIVHFRDDDALNIWQMIEHIQMGLDYIIGITDLHADMEVCYNEYLDRE